MAFWSAGSCPLTEKLEDSGYKIVHWSEKYSLSTIMANSQKETGLSVDEQSISIFFEFADLKNYEALFQGFGVDKFDHLNDVEEDDLRKFGM